MTIRRLTTDEVKKLMTIYSSDLRKYECICRKQIGVVV